MRRLASLIPALCLTFFLAAPAPAQVFHVAATEGRDYSQYVILLTGNGLVKVDACGGSDWQFFRVVLIPLNGGQALVSEMGFALSSEVPGAGTRFLSSGFQSNCNFGHVRLIVTQI